MEAEEIDQTNTIDLSTDFSIETIRRQTYGNYNAVVNDLLKLIRFIDNGDMVFICKIYNERSKKFIIKLLNETNARKMLSSKLLWREDKKQLNAYNVFQKFIKYFAVADIAFNSKNPKVFSLFQGFKYSEANKIDYLIIGRWLNLVKEVVANNNKDVYEYILNWIAFIIQNVGVKTGIALVLKGRQGIGKGRFSDVVAELISGYSQQNITDIAELTGTFNSVVEGNMLIVLNEIRNVGEERMANFDSLKSIITEDKIRINEKNMPRREAENVANFIFITNNSYPVKVEEGDRRYLVCDCSSIRKDDFDYFQELSKGLTPLFYQMLFTYFIQRDLKDFNVRKIPMTEAKNDLIMASRCPIDDWISENLEKLKEGMLCTDALENKPREMRDKNFQLAVKQKCDRIQIQKNRIQKHYYKLKEEYKEYFEKMKQSIGNEKLEPCDEVEIEEI
jgi:putative DNA primase/helicase